MKELGYDPEW